MKTKKKKIHLWMYRHAEQMYLSTRRPYKETSEYDGRPYLATPENATEFSACTEGFSKVTGIELADREVRKVAVTIKPVPKKRKVSAA